MELLDCPSSYLVSCAGGERHDCCEGDSLEFVAAAGDRAVATARVTRVRSPSQLEALVTRGTGDCDDACEALIAERLSLRLAPRRLLSRGTPLAQAVKTEPLEASFADYGEVDERAKRLLASWDDESSACAAPPLCCVAGGVAAHELLKAASGAASSVKEGHDV